MMNYLSTLFKATESSVTWKVNKIPQSTDQGLGVYVVKTKHG